MGSCEVEGEMIAVGSVPALVVVVVVVVIQAEVVVPGPVATGGKELSSISARHGAERVRRIILIPGDPAPPSIFPALLS